MGELDLAATTRGYCTKVAYTILEVPKHNLAQERTTSGNLIPVRSPLPCYLFFHCAPYSESLGGGAEWEGSEPLASADNNI